MPTESRRLAAGDGAPSNVEVRFRKRRSNPIAQSPHARDGARQVCHLSPIRAQFNSADACSALGLTVNGNAPLLKLCRALVERGIDPKTPLHAYWSNEREPSLIARSIGEAARLRVASHGVGFELLPECTPGAPITQLSPAGSSPAPAAAGQSAATQCVRNHDGRRSSRPKSTSRRRPPRKR